MCALLHILPTPEVFSPKKLSGVSGWYNAEVSSHYVYIMGSQSKVLYVGCTHDLVQRVYQHKHTVVEGFKKSTMYTLFCILKLLKTKKQPCNEKNS